MDVVWLKRDLRMRDHGPLADVLNLRQSLNGVNRRSHSPLLEHIATFHPTPLLKDLSVCRAGEVSPAASKFALLYLYEPSQLQHPTVHGSHVAFASEGLLDLDASLASVVLGLDETRSAARAAPSGVAGAAASDTASRALAAITTRIGEAVGILSQLHNSSHGPIKRLLSHEETGHMASYNRDKAVRRWCRQHCVRWVEYPQTGVVRGLRSRADTEGDPFAARWSKFMNAPQHPDPRTQMANRGRSEAVATASSMRLLPAADLKGLGALSPTDPRLRLRYPADRPHRQVGGERRAAALLSSFLRERGRLYSAGISSPTSSWTSCSRLSTYLSWGHISLRCAYQALDNRQQVLRAKKKGRQTSATDELPIAKGSGSTDGGSSTWLKSLNAFAGRLRWRSHFMQKLEMEPQLEERCQVSKLAGGTNAHS
eukprot:SAG31_NODE_1050_length_10160_cov_3.844648_6_plen_427_part_00